MTAGLILPDDQLILDLLLQFGHMGNDSDQSGTYHYEVYAEEAGAAL